MRPLRMEGKLIDLCPGCSAMWFDRGELAGASGLSIPEHRIRSLGGDDGPRPCPACAREMLVVEAHPGSGVLVETCPQCMGFFLDRGEYDKLRTLFGPAAARRADAIYRSPKPLDDAHADGPGVDISSDSLGWTIFQYLTGLPLEADVRQALFSPVVTVLILANVAVFIAAMIAGFEDIMLAMAMVPKEVLAGERLHTIVTSMFAHGGPFHLIGNMWFLFVCGDNTETRLGWKQFLALYLLAGLTATVVYLASAPGSDVPTLGASGAVSGVLGAYVVLFPAQRFIVRFFWFFWLRPISFQAPAWLYLGFWFVMQFALAFVGGEGVAWWAHVGGFATGAAWAYAYRRVRAARGATALS